MGTPPKLRIVDFFIDNPLFDFTKKEVIEALEMSKQTFYKHFQDIEKSGIVKVTRKIGRAKLYRLNPEHPLVQSHFRGGRKRANAPGNRRGIARAPQPRFGNKLDSRRFVAYTPLNARRLPAF